MPNEHEHERERDQPVGWSPAEDFIDRGHWPVVRIRYPAYVTKRALDVHFAAMADLVARRERFAAIVDIDPVRNMSRDLRHYIATQLKRYDSTEIGTYLVGLAHVSNHWLGRASLTLVLSLSPPSYPNRTFRRLEDAEAWVHTLLPS